MENQVKQLRNDIDALSQLTKSLTTIETEGNPNIASMETKEAASKLLFAKAWLGKVLHELGVESPYKAGYKTVADIEPTADVAKDSTVEGWEAMNNIEKVDYIRTALTKVTDTVKDLATGIQTSREFAISRTNSYNCLCEAKFWLGFELQRIKESV